MAETNILLVDHDRAREAAKDNDRDSESKNERQEEK